MKKTGYLILIMLLLLFIPVRGSALAQDEGSEDIYEVCMQYTVINTELTGVADVENAINAISVPRIGVRVHIVPVFIGNLPADTAYAVAGGEKIDIVNVGLTNDMSTLVSDGLLLPLDELLAERGSDVSKVTALVADAGKINGITYAISQYPYAASCNGFLYNKEIADAYHIDMHDGITLDELEEAGAVLEKQDILLTSVGLSEELSYKFFCSMENFGEAGNYGVILNPAEQTEIVNIYDSEDLRSFYKRLRSWYEKGYLPSDPMLNESAIMQLFASQKLFCVPTNVNAGQLGNYTGMGFERAICKTSDILVSTSSAKEFMLGIAATCQNPEAAMDFINLIYTDPEVANLLNYGVQGLDYLPAEGTENVITRKGTPNEDNSRYGSGFVRFGNPLDIKIAEPLTDSYYQEILDWEAAAHRSLSFGYSFDASAFAVESRSISRIISEYLPILNVGIAEDVDAQLNAMNQKLKEAGIERIIEANKQQLEAYLKHR